MKTSGGGKKRRWLAGGLVGRDAKARSGNAIARARWPISFFFFSGCFSFSFCFSFTAFPS
jgi:hypothetical protein